MFKNIYKLMNTLRNVIDLKITVGQAGSEDYLAWNYTKNENFSVSRHTISRSSSNLSKLVVEAPRCHVMIIRGWLALWDVDVGYKTGG